MNNKEEPNMKPIVILLPCLIYTLSLPVTEAQLSKTEQKKGTSNRVLKATTEDGRKVRLKPNGTWEFAQASSGNAKVVLPASVSKALAEFAKIAGSTELGVEYDEYKSILISFKGTVDQALRDLPDDSLEAELGTALNKYEIALKKWSLEIDLRKYKLDGWSEQASKAIDQRYDLWRENRSSLGRANQLSKQYERE